MPGVTAPLAYLGAFVIALMLGYVLAQFSKYMTSAGTYYTFVSRSLGGRMGFLVAWTYLLFYPVVVAQVGSFMGDTLQNTLKAEYGWTFKWWWFMVILIVLVAVTAYRGIEISTEILVVLGIIETLIVLALAFSGFIDPGPGGINFEWASPANAPSGHALFLGVVFAIFAISGWDAAAPTAEESEDPKRNVPRGVIGCTMIAGGRESMLAHAGEAAGERIETPEEHAARPEFILYMLVLDGGQTLGITGDLETAVAAT